MVKGIVTLYYPEKQNRDNVLRILKQVDWLFICDNSPVSSEAEYADYKRITYFHWGENRGLSYAFNTVLKDTALGWHEKDYVIFFDQDTVIAKHHIEKLVNEYEKLKKKQIHIGCLGVCYFNTSNHVLQLPRKKVWISRETLDVSKVITSSMLCRYGDLRRIHFWNDDVFLDMADWDLCWRFKKNGYKCCMTKVSVISHSIGTGEKKIGFITMRVGRPVREYYELRDCRYLLKKDYVPFQFKIRFVLMILVRSVMHILFLDEKKERIMYMNKARKDYCHNVKGAVSQGG